MQYFGLYHRPVLSITGPAGLTGPFGLCIELFLALENEALWDFCLDTTAIGHRQAEQRIKSVLNVKQHKRTNDNSLNDIYNLVDVIVSHV